ncbi:MAG: EF-hand domain-containing protein [Pseudomonadota bacterium]
MKRVFAVLAVAMLAAGAAQAADFADVDTDADGSVSLDEAVSQMPDLTEDAFLSADANEDGALSPDEFASMKN